MATTFRWTFVRLSHRCKNVDNWHQGVPESMKEFEQAWRNEDLRISKLRHKHEAAARKTARGGYTVGTATAKIACE